MLAISSGISILNQKCDDGHTNNRDGWNQNWSSLKSEPSSSVSPGFGELE